MRFALKPSGLLVFTAALFAGGSGRAADATTPLDYTNRNTPFAAQGSVAPDKKKPEIAEAVQQKRVDKSLIEKSTAPLAERRAAVDVNETREKQIWVKNSRRPEKSEQPTSEMNQRTSKFSTRDDTTKPPLVAKYQDSLVAASASNMARFPAVGAGTSAKINRFVFRKNPPESVTALPEAKVTPAGGGAKVGR